MLGEYDMRSVAPTICMILGVRPPASNEVEALEEVVETMGAVERLAVVVIDAFGASTWAAARLEVPTFNAMANRHLLHIRSLMPTITPVNFATMLTGAHPETHMIRDRTERLTLETVFDVLREHGRVSATAARAVSSLGILISPFADRPGLAESNNDEEVCAIAVKAMEKKADLLWVQLLDVDDAGHLHGPLSSEGVSAIHRDDAYLREIAETASRNGYGLMVLADHGQHTVLKSDGSQEGTHGTNSDDDVYVPFAWCTNRELKEAIGI